MSPEPRVPLDAMQEADVLLYRGKGTLSKLIRFFDGTDVSHAGLYRADATVAEALGGGLERRPIATSAKRNEWLRVRRLTRPPDIMTPVAAVADAYLSQPNRYGYEQILLLAFLGASRRLPVTPLLAPLLRKILDGAASLVAQLTRGGREPLICSEFVFRCYQEALPGSDDPYELRISGLGPARHPRLRAPVGGRVERGSLADRLARTPPATRRPGIAAREERPETLRGIDALGEAYLRGARVRARALARVEMPLAEVEPALMRFADALANAARRPGATRRAPPPALSRKQVSRTLSRMAADFVTPGDLLKSPSLVTLGRLDLSAGMRRLPVPLERGPSARRGTTMSKFALCIGINDYPGTGSDLAGCVNDVRDWSRALKDRGFRVEHLLNRQATGRNIREAIRAVIAQATSGDVVAIQYSGHGSYVPDLDGDEPDGTDECICPYDVNTKGEITDDELFRLYSAKQPGVRLVVLSDSCHSGTVARFAPIRTPPTARGRSAPQRKVRFLPPEAFLSRAKVNRLGQTRRARPSSPPGRYGALLMAGCQDTEYSYDAYFRGRPNGAFTYVALQALAKLPRNATYRDWFVRVRKMLPSQQYPQSPNLFGSSAMKKWKVLA